MGRWGVGSREAGEAAGQRLGRSTALRVLCTRSEGFLLQLSTSNIRNSDRDHSHRLAALPPYLASPHPVCYSCMPATVSGLFCLHPAPHPLHTQRGATLGAGSALADVWTCESTCPLHFPAPVSLRVLSATRTLLPPCLHQCQPALCHCRAPLPSAAHSTVAGARPSTAPGTRWAPRSRPSRTAPCPSGRPRATRRCL